MVFFYQMPDYHMYSAFIVTDQGMTIRYIHHLCKKNSRHTIIFACKFVRIIFLQLDSQGSIIDDQSIQPTDQAIIMYGIKLIIIGILLAASQHILKKILSPGSQEKADIYIQLLCRL